MLVIVSYDISTETKEGRARLNKISKCCIRYGQRVQNSLYECNIDYTQYKILEKELNSLINIYEDSIRIYNFGNKYKNKVTHIGIKPSIDMDDSVII